MASVEDPLQQAMGELGRWHIFEFCLLSLSNFPVVWHQMGIKFLAPQVMYTCVPSETESGKEIDLCSSECEKHYNRSIFTETIITEWDLVCDKGLFPILSQSIVIFGIITGNVFYGVLADNFGRRLPLVTAVLVQLVSSVGTSFSNSFWVFCCLRFITAVGIGGTMIISFVLIMEIMGIKYREIFCILCHITFSLGHLILPFFAYYLREWRYFNFTVSILSVLFISYYWLIPESPRWFFAVNRIDDAVMVLSKVAKWNYLPLDHIAANIEQYRKDRSALQTRPLRNGNAMDLVRTKNLRLKTMCMCFAWFLCGLTVFGVERYISETGGDIFSNVAIMAAIPIPSILICVYCTKVYGRKRTLICSNMLTGIAMLAMAFVESNRIAIFVIGGIGIAGLNISFPTLYLYSGELFPTVVRCIGIGVASTLARFGSMIAPFAVGLGVLRYFIPPIIFGVASIIAAGVVLLLPETRGIMLPETIEDGENFGKKHGEKA